MISLVEAEEVHPHSGHGVHCRLPRPDAVGTRVKRMVNAVFFGALCVGIVFEESNISKDLDKNMMNYDKTSL